MSDNSSHEVLEFPDEGIEMFKPKTQGESLGGLQSNSSTSDHAHTDLPDDYGSYAAAELTKYIAPHAEMALQGFDALMKTGEESGLPEHIIDKVRGFEKRLAELREEVSSPEAIEKLEKARHKFVREDDHSIPENISELRLSRKKKRIFDFDGTISNPSYRGKSSTDPYLASSDPFDYYLGHQRSTFKYAAAPWVEDMGIHPEVYRAGGQQVPLREGADKLLEELVQDPDGEVIILTTNFLPFMEGFLSRIEGGDKIKLLCVREGNINSTAKGDMIKKIAIDDPDAVIEYIGDGETDTPALEAASVVGVYHSVKGLGFDKVMDERSIAHLPFDNISQLRQNLGLLPVVA